MDEIEEIIEGIGEGIAVTIEGIGEGIEGFFEDLFGE